MPEKQHIRVRQPQFGGLVFGIEDADLVAHQETGWRTMLLQAGYQFPTLGLLICNGGPAEPDVVSHPCNNPAMAIYHPHRPRVCLEQKRTGPNNKPGRSPSGRVGGDFDKQTSFLQNQLPSEIVPAPVGSQRVVMPRESHRWRLGVNH